MKNYKSHCIVRENISLRFFISLTGSVQYITGQVKNIYIYITHKRREKREEESNEIQQAVTVTYEKTSRGVLAFLPLFPVPRVPQSAIYIYRDPIEQIESVACGF